MELSPNSDFKSSTLSGVFDHLLKGKQGVAIINSEKRIVQSNDLFEEIFGEVGCLDEILNYPGQIDQEEEVYSFLNSCEHNRSHSFNIFTKSEYVNLSLRCFRNEGIKYFIAKVDQVSENHPISSLVKESLAFSKLIASSTFELIFRCTEDGKLIYFNRLFAKTLDYPSLLAARKKGINEILSGDFHRIKEELNSSETNMITEQVWLRKNNGGLIRGLANISVHRNRNAEYIYNWVVLDLTQYTEYEKYLKTTNTQLKRVSFQLEQFLYSTSHDLRSPLTSIMGLVNLIKGEVQNDTVEKYVNLIEQTAFGLDTVIKNIAYLTRINYYESNYERIDMQRLIWNIISEYTRDPESKSIQWKVDVDESFYFYSDEEKIEIILDQLIKNAIAFRDPAKAQSTVEVTVMEQNDNVVITVFDNGVGIEDKHINQVCNLFYKASSLSAGSGLGLFIVKEALDNLDGKLNIGSQVEVGSWITMEIPNQKRKYLVSESRKSNNKVR
ncbi:PAS domain-containing sensor histidine kinase [Fulvivirga sediminis]|nr:PAS domain-containing sensor histidine kinase [Fulvivirga sediminis]